MFFAPAVQWRPSRKEAAWVELEQRRFTASSVTPVTPSSSKHPKQERTADSLEESCKSKFCFLPHLLSRNHLHHYFTARIALSRLFCTSCKNYMKRELIFKLFFSVFSPKITTEAFKHSIRHENLSNLLIKMIKFKQLYQRYQMYLLNLILFLYIDVKWMICTRKVIQRKKATTSSSVYIQPLQL